MAMFSDRLRQLRTARDLSQSELAKMIGISKSSVNMYERGEREPNFETLERFADYFNVDMDYLLGKSNIIHKFSCGVNAPHMVMKPTITQIEDAKHQMLEEFGISDRVQSGKRLAFLLGQLGMDTNSFSVCYGVDELQIYNWVHSQQIPDDETLDAVMDALNVSLFSFLSAKEQEDWRSRRKRRSELKKDAPTGSGGHIVELDDVEFALYGGLQDLTEDDKETILDMVRVMRERRKNKGY